MKVVYPSNVLGVVTGVVVVAGLVLGPRVLAEEPPVRRGALAVGIAPDGALLVRSTLCAGAPSPITVSHGAPNGSGARALPEVAAAVEARVDLPASIGDRTTLTISAPELEGVVVTPAQWRSLRAGTWLVPSAPESRDTAAVPGDELGSRSC